MNKAQVFKSWLRERFTNVDWDSLFHEDLTALPPGESLWVIITKDDVLFPFPHGQASRIWQKAQWAEPDFFDKIEKYLTPCIKKLEKTYAKELL